MGAIESGFIGQSLKRKEDARFLTGAGQYTDDVTLPNQTYACFLRSPHAHARIRKIDVAKAQKAPGVVAVYTSAESARRAAADDRVRTRLAGAQGARDRAGRRRRFRLEDLSLRRRNRDGVGVETRESADQMGG